MPKHKLIAAALVAASLTGCAGAIGESADIGLYRLVRVKPIAVGDGSMVVTPPREWNRQRRLFDFFDTLRWVEDWTLNGPYLDGITFVAGLPNRQALVRQRYTEERQVPQFRSNMAAPEIAAMIESAFRVRGGAVEFRTLNLQPRPLAGYPGFQFDYEHLDSDEVWRKGRSVGAVINGRLYLILFDAARSHYYANAINDFEAMANSARLRR